jgi:hypothetical protein
MLWACGGITAWVVLHKLNRSTFVVFDPHFGFGSPTWMNHSIGTVSSKMQ